MNISWNWLLQYVRYRGDRDQAIHRMTMSGLNVDGVEELPGGDFRLDVEVTSNRPDCLGHLGVARELAALTGSELVLPPVDYPEGSDRAADLTSVQVLDPKGCPRYTARVIRGVKVGPSPAWLVQRIEAVGLRPVNNVVDVTNFVLYEHGQPLHAFDYNLLAERRIVVRRASRGEAFTAIDHTQHRLEETDLVIADARRPMALAGVMGGLDSEVTERTTDVLLESAMFDPLSIRATSRREGLLSDASYRFERGVDYDGVDWAARRACRLILEVAGGSVARGAADVSVPPASPVRAGQPKVILRYAQVARLLGVEVPQTEVLRILTALGTTVVRRMADAVEVVPPRFRRDLTREADLIEEVARVHGYDQVPYLDHIPTVTPLRVRNEEVVRRLEDILVACGYQEAVTLTLTDAASASLFAQGDAMPPLTTRGTITALATAVRKSVLPGLLDVKRTNQDAGLAEIAVFEIARGFRDAGPDAVPHESRRLALLADDGPEAGQGSIETIAERLGFAARLSFRPVQRIAELDADGQADVCLDAQPIGFCGLLGRTLAERYKFRHAPWVAELELSALIDAAVLVSRYQSVPQLPAIERDLALILDEAVLWRDVAECIRAVGVAELEDVACVSLFRGKQIPEGRKCLAVRLRFRGQNVTLTHQQADAFQARILARAKEVLKADLRAG